MSCSSAKREAPRSPESAAHYRDTVQEGAFHRLPQPVDVSGLESPSQQLPAEGSVNGIKASWEKETFSFFLLTQSYPWLWQKWPRKQIVTLGPSLHGSLTPNLSRRITNGASLPLPYHRQDLRYQEKGMKKERDGVPAKGWFQVSDIHSEPQVAGTYRCFNDGLGSQGAIWTVSGYLLHFKTTDSTN